MIQNMTIKQHIEMAEKQWKIIAETGCTKLEAWKKLGVDYCPSNCCYLCEAFQIDDDQAFFNDKQQQNNEEHCSQCPLSPDGTYCQCNADEEPYDRYCDARRLEVTKLAAIDLLEQIRIGKKRLNL